jgi:hypothetical protein
MAELPKIVFSKTLKPPLTWANTVMAEPVETAVPALKAMDDTPMRTIGSPSRSAASSAGCPGIPRPT